MCSCARRKPSLHQSNPILLAARAFSQGARQREREICSLPLKMLVLYFLSIASPVSKAACFSPLNVSVYSRYFCIITLCSSHSSHPPLPTFLSFLHLCIFSQSVYLYTPTSPVLVLLVFFHRTTSQTESIAVRCEALRR